MQASSEVEMRCPVTRIRSVKIGDSYSLRAYEPAGGGSPILRNVELCPPSAGTTAFQRITFETDPVMDQRRKRAHQHLLACKAALRLYMQSAGHKPAFDRLVRAFTRYVTVKVAVRPRKYKWVKVPDHVIWTTVWDKRYVTEYAYLKLLLRDAKLSATRLRKVQRRVAWMEADERRLRRYNTTKTHVWRYNPRKIVVKRIKFPKRRVVVRELKRIPLRNWIEIHKRWSRRMRLWRKEYTEKYMAQVEAARAALDQVSWKTQHRFNQCCEFHNQAPLPSYQPRRPDPAISACKVGHWVVPSGGPAVEVGWDAVASAMPGPNYPRALGVYNADEPGWRTRMFVRTTSLPPHASQVGFTWGLLQFYADQEASVVDQQPDWEWMAQMFGKKPTTWAPHPVPWMGTWTLRIDAERLDAYPCWTGLGSSSPEPRPGSDRPAEVHSLDSESVLQPLRGNLEDEDADNRCVASMALRNLNLRRDAVTFNFARSLSEQKDLPRSLKTGGDFLHWAKATSGQPYYRLVDRYGNVRMVPGAGGAKADRWLIERYFKPHASYQDRVALKRQYGLKSLKRKVITPTTTMSTLASLYLGWKFAVEPTASDIVKIQTNGMQWTVAVRRGLQQLLPTYRPHGNCTVLRRTWSTTLSASAPKGNTKKTSYSEEHKESGTFVWDDVWSFPPEDLAALWSPSAYQRILKRTREAGTGFSINPSPGVYIWVPCIVSEKGLLGLHPMIKTPQGFTDEEWDRQVRPVLDSLNRSKLTELGDRDGLPRWLYKNAVFTRQVLGGLAFARFSAEQLDRALRPESQLAQNALRWHPYLTAWELTPLSFVTEWFTNLHAMQVATNDLLEMQFSRLNPKGGVWETRKSSLWAGSPGEGDCVLSHVRVEPIETSCTRVTQSYERWHESLQDYVAYGATTTFVPTSIRVKMEFVHYLQSLEMRKTGVHYFVRRPQTDGLVDLVPKPRVRVNIQPGQAGSLALIALSELMTPKQLKAVKVVAAKR